MSATVHNLAAHRTAKHPELECWIPTKALAAHLGFSTKWVTRQVAKGMPHARMGTRLRFKMSVVEAWLIEEGNK